MSVSSYPQHMTHSCMAHALAPIRECQSAHLKEHKPFCKTMKVYEQWAAGIPPDQRPQTGFQFFMERVDAVAAMEATLQRCVADNRVVTRRRPMQHVCIVPSRRRLENDRDRCWAHKKGFGHVHANIKYVHAPANVQAADEH